MKKLKCILLSSIIFTLLCMFSISNAAVCPVNGGKHVYSAATCTKPKTCDCGATTGTALGHSYSSTCTAYSKAKHYVVCTRCPERSYNVHTYDLSTTENATCTTNGFKAYKCIYCGFNYTEIISATGHNCKNSAYVNSTGNKHYQICNTCQEKVYSAHVPANTVTKKPTCTTSGILTHKCKYCSFKSDATIPATGHDYENAGYTYLDSNRHYQKCNNNCGTKLYGNHTIKDGKCTLCKYDFECKHTGVLSVATCTGPSYCDHCEQAVKPALGHDYQPESVSTKKTATESVCTTTTTKYKCSRCVATTTKTTVDKIHSTTGTVTTPAKCTTKGVMTYKCADCGYTYTKTISATGHNYVNGVCTKCNKTSSSGTSTGTSSETTTETTILAKKIEFEADIINLEVNKSKTLTLKVTPENANEEITYKTSDAKYVTVTNAGKIKAIKAGASVTITATTASGKTAKCEVIVPIKSTVTVLVGKTVLLTPLNSDDVWTSSNEEVIYFDGQKCVVNSAGKCTLTATLKENSKIVTSRMEVTVLEDTTVVEPEPDTEPDIEPDVVPDIKSDVNEDNVKGFEDVTENDWFADSVEYVTDNELMNGVSKDSFEPTGAMTRGMILTVLYRMYGDEEYTLKGSYSFVDVNANQYYYFAIMWGAENNIVNGVGENRFDPDAEVTREQLATILYRYAKFAKISTSVSTSAQKSFKKKFADYNEISDYAIDSLQWTFKKEIISGRTETAVCPKESVTRAEAATMFKRFLENTKK